MAGLTLNGIEVPVLRNGLSLGWTVIQDKARSYDGTWRKTEYARKREWKGEIKPQSQALTDAFRNLIRGIGYTWSFDADVFSAQGLAANGGHTATIVAGGKYGSLMRVPAATTITWPTNLGSNWTVVVWRLESAVWHHYVATSGGHKWVDGVRNDAASTTFISVSSGSLTITGATSLTDFDEMAALPYLVDDTWPPFMYTEDNTRARTALPRLSANGDLVFNGPTSVVGEPGDSDVLLFSSAGSIVTNGEKMSFLLSES